MLLARRAQQLETHHDGRREPGTTQPASYSLPVDGEPARKIADGSDRHAYLQVQDRITRAFSELTRGHGHNVREVVGDGIVEVKHNGMVLVRDIEVHALGEHNLLPFTGTVHIAYVPRDKSIRPSRLPLVVELFARRLQTQERLTVQVARAMEDVLSPDGVSVIVEATHTSLQIQGVKKQHAIVVTRARRGVFLDDPYLFEEFQRLVGTASIRD